EHLHLAFLFEFLELEEILHTAPYGVEIGQRSAEPPGVDVRHSRPRRFLGYYALGLLFGAHEEDLSAVRNGVSHEIVSLFEQTHRLLQVNYVYTVPAAEDELLHLRIPVAYLVAEMDPGF